MILYSLINVGAVAQRQILMRRQLYDSTPQGLLELLGSVQYVHMFFYCCIVICPKMIEYVVVFHTETSIFTQITGKGPISSLLSLILFRPFPDICPFQHDRSPRPDDEIFIRASCETAW